MALDSSNMAYGRGDYTSLIRLQNAITERIARARKELTGAAYNELVSVIRNNWSGQDADKYLKLLEEIVKELDSDYQALNKEINVKLSNDWRQFQHVGQAKIADSITRK